MAALVALPAPAQREQPHNVDAEKSVLGAVFIKPTAFDELSATLQVDDFFLPAHREIFEAMLALDKRRQPIDVIAVADELKTRGMLARLDGGEAYLLALANATPTAENVTHYARLVKEKATLRRLIAACAEVQSSAYGNFGDFDGFVADAEAKIAKVARQGRAAPRSLASLVDQLAPRGARLTTGLRTLDAAHRGGFLPGRFVVVGGAPGAGKTSLAVALAVKWALEGAQVSVLAADEPAIGLLVRVGQILGLDRRALEDGDAEAREALRAAVADVPGLTILDADDASTTIEAAAATLRPERGPSVLVVDSLQMARAAGSAEAETPRARVEAVLCACKATTRRGITVVATSELARGAYRSRDAAERTDDLAAGKESGAIEYAAGSLLVLRSVPDANGQIDVTIPKNRGGDKTPFRLAMNFERATLHETALPEGRPVGGLGLDSTTQLETDMTAAREALRKEPAGAAGIWGLARKMGAMSNARKDRAIKALIDAGEIQVEKGPGKVVRLFLVVSPPSPPNSPPSPRGSGARLSPRTPPTPIGGGVTGGDTRGQYDDGSDDDEPGESHEPPADAEGRL
jgi:replicative DNA helicase